MGVPVHRIYGRPCDLLFKAELQVYSLSTQQPAASLLSLQCKAALDLYRLIQLVLAAITAEQLWKAL